MADVETDSIESNATVTEPGHLVSGTGINLAAMKNVTPPEAKFAMSKVGHATVETDITSLVLTSTVVLPSKDETDSIETKLTTEKPDHVITETDTTTVISTTAMAEKDTDLVAMKSATPSSKDETDLIETKVATTKPGHVIVETDATTVAPVTTMTEIDTGSMDTHEEPTETVSTVDTILVETDDDSMGLTSAASASGNGVQRQRSKEIDAGPIPTKNAGTHRTGSTRRRDNNVKPQVEKVKLQLLTAAEVRCLTRNKCSIILTLAMCTQQIRMWLQHIELGIFSDPFKEVSVRQHQSRLLSAAHFVVCRVEWTARCWAKSTRKTWRSVSETLAIAHAPE